MVGSESISSSVTIDPTEEPSSVFCIIRRGPELFEHAKGAQWLGFCLFKRMLIIPDGCDAQAIKYALSIVCDLTRST